MHNLFMYCISMLVSFITGIHLNKTSIKQYDQKYFINLKTGNTSQLNIYILILSYTAVMKKLPSLLSFDRH